MRMGLCMCVFFVLVMFLCFKVLSHFDTMPCIEVYRSICQYILYILYYLAHNNNYNNSVFV